MDWLDKVIVSGIFVLLVYLVGWYARRWWARGKPQPKTGDHFCDICGANLPKDAIRTHRGHWRCAEHKAL